MHTIGDLRDRVDDAISTLTFRDTPRDLYQPILYMLASGAKRTRPVLVLCGCDLFGGDIAKALMPSLGMEMFHNFTLLHDDIMDNAPLRRSRETVHAKWNTNVAILAGDAMFVKACQLMMMTDDQVLRPVMELFHKTAIEVCEGQQLDMDFENASSVTIPDYIHMITNKTAVLLGACLETGALIAGAGREDASHIYEFGKNIGIAFQLKDDILDVFGDASKFGKVSGGDIVANKKTFLWLKALELADTSLTDDLLKWTSTGSPDPAIKVDAVKSIYEKLNVRHFAESEMNTYFQIAMNHLEAISVDDRRKEPLRSFAESLMVREA